MHKNSGYSDGDRGGVVSGARALAVVSFASCAMLGAGCVAAALPAVQLASAGIGAANEGYAVWTGGKLTYVEQTTFARANEAIDIVIERLDLRIDRDSWNIVDPNADDAFADPYYQPSAGRTTGGTADDGTEPATAETRKTARRLHVSSERGAVGAITVLRHTERMTSIMIDVGPFGEKAPARLVVDRINTELSLDNGIADLPPPEAP